MTTLEQFSTTVICHSPHVPPVRISLNKNKYLPSKTPTHRSIASRLVQLLLTILTSGLLLASPLVAAPKDHIIAIGVCPPWKDIPAEFCTDTVFEMQDALANRYNVPSSNIYTLVNEAATVDGLVNFLEKLPPFGSDDRVFLYVVMHNGSGTTGQDASPQSDVMVFYTPKQPHVIEFAIARRQWMTAVDFSDQIHRLKMGTLIAIFDACQSGALSLDVLHNADGATARIATIASAEAGQLANLTPDLSRPLFSSVFLSALPSIATPLSDVLGKTIADVTKRAVPICEKRRDQMRANNGFDPDCDQTPIIHDPNSLLPEA